MTRATVLQQCAGWHAYSSTPQKKNIETCWLCGAMLVTERDDAYGEGYGCQTIDGSQDLLKELWCCKYRHSEESEPLEAAIKIYKAGCTSGYSADGYQEFCARAIQRLFQLSAVGFRAAIDSQGVRAFWRRATIPDWMDNQV